MVSKPDLDFVLSELDEKYQKEVKNQIDKYEQINKSFEEITDISEKIKSEEITVQEGQNKIDIIVEKYNLADKL